MACRATLVVGLRSYKMNKKIFIGIAAIVLFVTQAAAQTDSRTVQDLIERGITFLEQEKFDFALEEFNTALKRESNNSTVKSYIALTYSYRGDEYKNKKDYEKAIADYNAALKSDSNFQNAKNGLRNVYGVRAQAYLDKGELDKAVADYNLQEKAGGYGIGMPKWKIGDAYYARGKKYYESKNYDKAIADFLEAKKFGSTAKPDGNLYNAYIMRGADNLDNKKNYDMAIVDFNEALKLYPNGKEGAQANFNLGACYHNKGEYSRARFYYEQALRIDPNEKSAQDNLEILRKAGY